MSRYKYWNWHKRGRVVRRAQKGAMHTGFETYQNSDLPVCVAMQHEYLISIMNNQFY